MKQIAYLKWKYLFKIICVTRYIYPQTSNKLNYR